MRKTPLAAATWSTDISAKSAKQMCAPSHSGGKVVVKPTTFIPAERADSMPAGASSNTRHCSGATPSKPAACRYGSGSGLPLCTSSEHTNADGTCMPAGLNRTPAMLLGADVTTAQRSAGTWAVRFRSDFRKLDPQTPALDLCVILESGREHPGRRPDGQRSTCRRNHRQRLPGVTAGLIVVDPEREQALRPQTHGMKIGLQ